jgi:ferredoxin
VAHIEFDRDRCEGHGMCTNVAPGIFELTDDGQLRVLSVDVTAHHVDEARAAANVCPVRALQIVD